MNTKCFVLLRESNFAVSSAAKRSEMVFFIEHDENGKPHSGTIVQFFDEHHSMGDEFLIGREDDSSMVISSKVSYPVETLRYVWKRLIAVPSFYDRQYRPTNKMCANAQNLLNEIQSERGYSVLT
jgi:hypothetical protein